MDDADETTAAAVAYAAVCVDVEPWHLDRPFDYAVTVTADGWAAVDGSPVVVGSRVMVPFSGRLRRGVVLDVRDDATVATELVKPVKRSLGPHAWVTPDEAAVARWAADRWGGTQADVLRHALPKRVVAVETAAADAGWFPAATRPPSPDLRAGADGRPTPRPTAGDPTAPAGPEGTGPAATSSDGGSAGAARSTTVSPRDRGDDTVRGEANAQTAGGANTAPMTSSAVGRDLVAGTTTTTAPAAASASAAGWAALVGGGAVVDAVAQRHHLAAFWRPGPGDDVAARLDALAADVLDRGRDVLVVVPDRGSRVADELIDRLRQRLDRDQVVDARAGLGDRARYRAWLACRTGLARVLVGERSVAFWPLRHLGLGVVVDEANPALKERRSPRHHVREVVLERARRADAVGLLVGTVPSAPAWRLLREGRLHVVRPERAAERAAAPVVRPVPGGRTSRLQRSAVSALGRALEQGGHGVVLATLRGEGRALLCVACDTLLRCPRCDRTPRPGPSGVACEGCGWQQARRALRCPECRERRFRPLVAGAEQLGEELARSFPDATVAVLEGYDQPAPPPPSLLVVTRGSVMDRAPGPVHAVVLPGFDALLRRPELDAAEDALRLALRLADWTVEPADVDPADDAEADGEHGPRRGARRADRVVLVQTGDAEHHAVQALVARDPGAFWRAEAALRAELRLPPAARLVRLDAPGDGDAVADAVSEVLAPDDRLLGPVSAGRGRSALLVKTDDVPRLLAALVPARTAWSREDVDVRLDVDPVDVR